ncbi:ParB/RepB/Spo0J family partition protein [Burkholderia sp. PAMC 26561]|uniref:ParB/RepB/Spo0J family partition protein n=1 Tax=Burkholderia sp. PAMC 26561 TaxID=1795043 RepID=UPI00084E0530|nr:ParB/RepB/Spo0J family partition protein [Burkholderia sp. PAMC 26561]
MTTNQKAAKPKMGLGASIRKGIANERADVDGRLDVTGVPNGSDTPTASITVVGENDALGKTYEHRANASAVTPRVRLLLSELVSNPFNPREFYSPIAIDELAVRLRREGQHVAITVTRNHRHPDKYVIVDGEFRFRAKKSLGETAIDAEVVPELSDQELYLKASSINKSRTQQTVFDDAVAWMRVLSSGIFESQDALAERLSVSKALVSKTLLVGRLPKHFLQQMADTGSVGLAHAYNIKLILDRTNESTAESILERVVNGEMSVRRLEEYVKKLDGTSPPGATKTHYSGNVPFHTTEGREVGSLKRYRDGRTELKLVGLSDDQQSLLVTRLEKVVREFIATHLLDSPEAARPASGQSEVIASESAPGKTTSTN